ncbi:hypothetical protein FB563_7951 [Streptomyces puniciscabiei]|uniref:Uncharacterized protein n=1 Tax=Streptomyces puniciscabiei TaxID=164348 RepID=A0A542SYG1_9ACTN|nr:hypothetical protein FB563_7951 [Streptomyces puniciscabiei]
MAPPIAVIRLGEVPQGRGSAGSGGEHRTEGDQSGGCGQRERTAAASTAASPATAGAPQTSRPVAVPPPGPQRVPAAGHEGAVGLLLMVVECGSAAVRSVLSSTTAEEGAEETPGPGATYRKTTVTGDLRCRKVDTAIDGTGDAPHRVAAGT